MRLVLALSSALVAVSLSVPALADVASSSFGENETGYKFKDETMLGSGIGNNVARIRARPKAARSGLLRPRTQFVSEMLKSVEHM